MLQFGNHVVSDVTLELVRMPSGVLTYRLSADVDGRRSDQYAAYLVNDSEAFDEAAALLPARPGDDSGPVGHLPHTVLRSVEVTSLDSRPRLIDELRKIAMQAVGDFRL